MKKFVKCLSVFVVLCSLIFVVGCKEDDSNQYYSLKDLFKEIEEDPSEIVNSDTEVSKYVSFQGTISSVKKDYYTFVLSEDSYELVCYFTDDSIANEFFEEYKENDTVYVTGQIIKNNDEYQAVITEVGK